MNRLTRKPIVLHPFLFASFASLALIANNRSQLAGAGLRTVALSLLLAGLVYLGLWVIIRDGVRAGLVATAAIVLFFSYGHVLNLLQGGSSRTDYSAPVLFLWAALFAAWTYLVLRRVRHPRSVSNQLNLIALVVNLVPAITLLRFSSNPADLSELAAEYAAERLAPSDPGALRAPTTPPDVFYVVLDAYGREDVLRELYGYDNSAFIQGLRDRGFWVDDQALANYTHSELSMASSLNFGHIVSLPDFARSRGTSLDEQEVRIVAGELIRVSAVRQAFERMGYTSVAFDSGYLWTAMDSADRFVQSADIATVNNWELGAEFLLLDTTLGREAVRLLGSDKSPHQRLFDAHRTRVLFTLEHLADFAGADGPHFVFAHVISPHVPFVFDADGNPVVSSDPYTLLDARGGDPANIALYADQLHYLNTRVLAAIDDILAASAAPPIIILQSDHGSKVYSERDPPPEIRMRLFLPILNAIYAPGVELYSGMTPVNSFRVLFNQRFGGAFELAPDVSYELRPVEGRWQFVDACHVYPACEPLGGDGRD